MAKDQRAASIIVVDGMAGIGKTAFAVHAGHRLRSIYSDGQLYVDLHGFTDGVEPVAPSGALDRMLRALGVPGDQIPLEIEDRAALYRSVLADRRVLILLDNASSEAQVRPLLPAGRHCLALITSRSHLSGIEHAHPGLARRAIGRGRSQLASPCRW